MTNYQQQLLEDAMGVWKCGKRISMELAADMMREGMNVDALENKHLKED